MLLLQQRLKRRAEQMGAEEQAAAAGGEVDGGEQQHARRAGRLAVFLPHELWVRWVVPALPRTLSSPSCAYCGTEPPVGVKFKRCTGCKAASYCSRECQGVHWKEKEVGHKKVCVRARKASK